MQYLIIEKSKEAVLTNYYTHENMWCDDLHIVVDLINSVSTVDGKTWQEIKEDHL